LKFIVTLFIALLLAPSVALHAAERKPDIVFIIADDHGYGDAAIGVGSQHQTFREAMVASVNPSPQKRRSKTELTNNPSTTKD
jgi:hypothetical protein